MPTLAHWAGVFWKNLYKADNVFVILPFDYSTIRVRAAQITSS